MGGVIKYGPYDSTLSVQSLSSEAVFMTSLACWEREQNKRPKVSLSADESVTWFFFSSICTIWRLWPCSCDIASGIRSSIHSWGRTTQRLERAREGGAKWWRLFRNFQFDVVKIERKKEKRKERKKETDMNLSTVFPLLENVPKHLGGVKILL